MLMEQNKDIARRFFREVWSEGKLGILDEFTDTSYVGQIGGSPEIHGIEAFKEFISSYRGAFPDLEMTVEDIVAEGDKVITRWTARGTHEGELMGIPPTGKQVTVTGITIDRYVRGKNVKSWSNWDALGMMRQLGVVPAPRQGGA